MFSRENSKLQMIETAHVNKRKQAFTNQYPVGDDVSTPASAAQQRDSGPLATRASPATQMIWSNDACHAQNKFACRNVLLAALPVGRGKKTPRRFSGASHKGG